MGIFQVLVFLVIAYSLIQMVKRRNPPPARGAMARRPVMAPRKPVFDAFDPPPLLGLLPHVLLGPMVRRLEQAIGTEYGEKLRQRMRAAHRELGEDELDWRIFELKRYFLISTLLPETPMFSEAVDEVWHEMLMFTKEYQQFGEQYTGAMLHHAPNGEPVSQPGERAWFDWVYAHLFEPVAASTVLWNGFFRFPMSRERLDFAASAGEAELEVAWFHRRNSETFPEVRATAQLLARQFKEELHLPGRDSRFEEIGWDRREGGSLLFLAAGMLFFSSRGPELFEQGMNGLTENDELERLRNPGSASAGSSCTTGYSDFGPFGGGDGGSGSGSDGDGSGGNNGSGGDGDGSGGNNGSGGDGGSGSSCSSSSCSSGSSCSSSSCSSGSSCGGGSGCGGSS